MDRDVKLVISATDRASKAAEAVQKALVALDDAQKKAGESAEMTGSRLERFGASLGTLQQQIRAQSVGETIANQFMRAERAVDRLEDSIADSRREQTQFALDADKAARAVDRERQAVAKLDAQLQRERATLRALKSERTAANNAVARASVSGGADEGQIAAARRAEQAVEEQAQAVQMLTDKLRTQRAATREAERSARQFAEASIRAGEAVSRNEAELNSAREEYRRLGQEADKAGQALQRLSQSATRELRIAVGQQARVVQESQRALRDAQPGVATAAQEFRQAQQAAQQYADELGDTAMETRQAVAESERLEQAFMQQRNIARALKDEYREQQMTLGRLRNISRETATDVDEIAARQARFTAEQNRSRMAVDQIRQSMEGYRAALSRVEAQQQRATQRSRALGSAAMQTGMGFRQGAAGANSMRDALRRFYGEGRRALSITQRLRGEVLSLATSYVGFFAAFQGLGSTIQALQALEGATSRLNAVFDGDFDAVNNELDFLRRNADRLGIEFGTLADQYTRFAAATKNTPIEDDTRRIFLAVAEAGRVNNLSIEQLNGTLNALSQIASKGAVNMEELRQQLGDRLPGALQIMADGLGVTTEELNKLVETGQVSSEALVNFARELQDRYGAQLPKALETTTSEIGRLQNAVFGAQLQFAEGGFTDALTDLIRTTREVLQSPEFESFVMRLSSAVSGILRVVEGAVANFGTVLTVGAALLATKFAPVVVAAVTSLLNFRLALRGAATRDMGTFNTALATTTARMNTASGAATGLTGRLRALGGAIRGLGLATGIGVAFTVLTTVVTALSTRANETTAALNRQRKVMDALQNAYDGGARSANDFADALDNITLAEARKDLEALTKNAEDLEKRFGRIVQTGALFDEARGFGAFFDGRNDAGSLTGASDNALFGIGGDTFSQEIQDRINEQVRLLDEGAISAGEYANSIEALGESFDLTSKESEKLERVVRLGQEAVEARQQQRRALDLVNAKLGQVNGTLDDNAVATLAASNATDELSEGLDINARSAQGLEAALMEISKGVPELAAEMKKAEELKSLSEILEAEGLPGTIEGIKTQIMALQAVAGLGIPIISDNAAAQAEKLEEVIAVVQKRIEAINNPRTRSSGRDPFKQALDRLTDAIQSDEQGQAIQALKDQGRDLDAVLQERQNFVDNLIPPGATEEQKRRLMELGEAYVAFGRQIFAGEQAREAAEGLREVAQAAAEAQAELSAAQSPDTPDGRRTDFLAELNAEIAALEAQVDRTALTPDQIAAFDEYLRIVRETSTAVFNLAEAERAQQATLQEAEAASARVNMLLQTRRDLVEQLQAAQSRGSTEEMAELTATIGELDMRIGSARDKAIALWTALAGSDDQATAEMAEGALAALNTQLVEVETRMQGTFITLEQIGQSVANNLSDAVLGFAESIANGENAIKSLGQAFQNFAAQTLIQIAQMIIRALVLQAVFAALGIPTGAGAGGGGGIFSTLITAGVNHGGRKAGRMSNRTRRVDASLFVGAPRFHEGRIGSNEMPAIIERDEDVLTSDNPFHSSNLGSTVRGLQGGGNGGTKVKIVNMIDAPDMLDAALNDEVGQEVLLNWIRQNAPTVQSALSDG